jgi:glutamate synthase (NADPH/NADH) small chain
MEKRVLDRRLEQMRAEGVEFRASTNVGVDVTVAQLKKDFSAVLLTGGATVARDLPVPGRDLAGIHQAMEFLTLQNRRCEGDEIADADFISAAGKHVVIIGGGDTGADCIGTSHRQGAKSVTSLEILPKPPASRAADNPWPEWPRIYRVASAHEEGGDRLYAVSTKRFIDNGNGQVKALELVNVEMKNVDGRMQIVEVPGSNHELEADLVFLAMGFVGAERADLLDKLGVAITERGNVQRDARWMTSVDGVFAAGDIQRGQSLIVWAIAEGRAAAASIDKHLMGSTDLPAPLA